MDYSVEYGVRDYSKCDYERRPPALDFENVTEAVKKFRRYANITFYVSEGPNNPSRVRQYINDLVANRVSIVVRTNRSIYDSEGFQSARITLVDLPFEYPSYPPDEPSLNEVHDLIKGLYLENRRVCIAVQGYDEGAFVLMFALMVMGMERKAALDNVRQFDGELSLQQVNYLCRREEELLGEYSVLKTRRRPGGFFSGIVSLFVNTNH